MTPTVDHQAQEKENKPNHHSLQRTAADNSTALSNRSGIATPRRNATPIPNANSRGSELPDRLVGNHPSNKGPSKGEDVSLVGMLTRVISATH